MVIFIGLIFVFFGGIIVINEIYKLLCCKSTTTAKVIEFHEKIKNESNGRTERFFFPVYEYYVMGNKCVVKSDSGSRKPKYVVGDQVELKYNSNKPEHFLIKGEKNSLVLGIILLLAGVIIICAQFYNIFRSVV